MLWTVCTHAGIDKHLKFGLRITLYTYSLYGSREDFGQCASMQILTNIFNLVLDFIHIHTHCMGTEKTLDSAHSSMHRKTSTIWPETSYTYILTVWEQRRLWTVCNHAGIDKHLQLV